MSILYSNRIFIYLLFFFIVFLPTFAIENTKVAYIDLEYLFENSHYKDKINTELKEQKDKILQYKNKLSKEINSLKHEIKQKESLLSYTEFLEELTVLEDKINLLNEEKNTIEKDLIIIDNEYKSMIYDEIMAVLIILSEEENVDIFLSDKKAVLYGKNSLDLTQRAVDIMNEIDSRNTSSAK